MSVFGVTKHVRLLAVTLVGKGKISSPSFHLHPSRHCLWCGNDEGNLGCQVLFCYQAALRQLLEFGLFHGDPHAGNIFAMDDGRCTG